MEQYDFAIFSTFASNGGAQQQQQKHEKKFGFFFFFGFVRLAMFEGNVSVRTEWDQGGRGREEVEKSQDKEKNWMQYWNHNQSNIYNKLCAFEHVWRRNKGAVALSARVYV